MRFSTSDTPVFRGRSFHLGYPRRLIASFTFIVNIVVIVSQLVAVAYEGGARGHIRLLGCRFSRLSRKSRVQRRRAFSASFRNISRIPRFSGFFLVSKGFSAFFHILTLKILRRRWVLTRMDVRILHSARNLACQDSAFERHFQLDIARDHSVCTTGC